MFLVILMLAAVNVYLNRPADIDFGERDLVYSGVVGGENRYENYTRLMVYIDRIFLPHDTISYRSKAEYFAFGEEGYFGKRLTIKGRLEPSRSVYLPPRLNGKIIASSTHDHIFGMIFNPVRNYIDRLFGDLFRGDQYRIVSGLVLGGSGRLGEELKEVFSHAGVLHILAVSGLHVGFVGLFLGGLLLFVPLDHRIKFAVIMCGLVVYAGVTGFRPSVGRATLMAFLFGAALVSQRNVNSMHVVNITAIVFLLVNPMLLFDVSAQLSFGAVYGILHLYPWLQKNVINRIRNRIFRMMLRPMAVSFSAQVFVAPLVVYYFHRLPTYAVLTNLLIVPIASFIIFLLFLCLAVGWIWLTLARVIAFPAGILVSALVSISSFAAKMPFSAIGLTISPAVFLPYYCLFWKRSRRAALWLMLIVISIFSLAGAMDCLDVCTAAKGILITTPGGEHIFLTKKVSVAQRAFLERQGITELEYLFAGSSDYPVLEGFVPLPEKMHFTELTHGDVKIHISDGVRISYRDFAKECAWADLNEQSDRGLITHQLSDGSSERVVRGVVYNTAVDQVFFDLNLAVQRLMLLF